jgi:hypothetical protein
MDATPIKEMTRKDQILINRCWLFLQVKRISDITNAEGTHILEAWLHNGGEKPSQSTLSWPGQGDPGPEAWKIWKTFIKNHYTTHKNLLRQKLGKWTQSNNTRIHRAYYDPTTKNLWTSHQDTWSSHALRSESRRQITFTRGRKETTDRPTSLIPIDIILRT